ncbi:MAG: hypothetical protein WAN66_00675 [Limnoraphis robusta]|uniref:DUF928 domain-containing protein n=1 Tax=Limnoraphis robusta CS-951 TaxID=1637645 RepID=A0A0F5YBR9_9CYAN|nr:hypothetical protein [Limnoraphis robusta]KKD35675.1 hypothetical protein WN50_23900 [Limnoraphis robusta CS-951]
MVKFYGVLSAVTLSVMITGEGFFNQTLPNRIKFQAKAENSFLSQNETASPEKPRNNPPPFEDNGGARWREAFFNNEPPESQDGGSRGPALCPLTPVDEGTGTEVLSDRPTLIWQGQLARVELYADNGEQPIWSQDLSQGDQKVQYSGEALKPGQTYYLMMFETVSDTFPLPSVQVTFTVIDGEKRQQVSQDLEQLNRELKQQNVSEEVMALARFNYLAKNKLWSDALTEAFSVQNPSSDLQELLQKTIPQRFCN